MADAEIHASMAANLKVAVDNRNLPEPEQPWIAAKHSGHADRCGYSFSSPLIWQRFGGNLSQNLSAAVNANRKQATLVPDLTHQSTIGLLKQQPLGQNSQTSQFYIKSIASD